VTRPQTSVKLESFTNRLDILPKEQQFCLGLSLSLHAIFDRPLMRVARHQSRIKPFECILLVQAAHLSVLLRLRKRNPAVARRCSSKCRKLIMLTSNRLIFGFLRDGQSKAAHFCLGNTDHRPRAKGRIFRWRTLVNYGVRCFHTLLLKPVWSSYIICLCYLQKYYC